MTKIRIIDLSTAHSVPADVRKELMGKELSLYFPKSIKVTAQPTVGNTEAVEGYEQLCDESYAVTRQVMWDTAIRYQLAKTLSWLEVEEAGMFFFSKETCQLIC